MSDSQIRTRKDISKLEPAQLDILIRAFKGIQERDPLREDSFFHIAGLHGQPFRGAGYANPAWWGGYCHHGNVLFPTWHRAYLINLENALRTINGCGDLALPYWNELEGSGLPSIFTQPKYTYTSGPDKGKEVDNPLYSYKLQKGFLDRLSRKVKGQDVDYRKYKDYETVRFPYSGLVGPSDERQTAEHNAFIRAKGQDEVNSMLNNRVDEWLRTINSPNGPPQIGAREKYYQCLHAPNYTVFSNTTSASKHNDDNTADAGQKPSKDSKKAPLVFSIESPHNSMHLAIGGYDMADRPDKTGANGDMGENDTAAFDPIFYFHHCFIDMIFWSWQTLKDSKQSLSVIPYYPGTSPVDEQGPTPGISAGQWLDMDTPLAPFKKDNGVDGLTSNDVADIVKLGYTYDQVITPPPRTAKDTPVLRVAGIDRSQIAGSFVVSIKVQAENEEALFGYEPVFSRWHVAGCANCRNSLTVPMHIPLVYYEAPGVSPPAGYVPGAGWGSGGNEDEGAPPADMPPLDIVSPVPVEQAKKLNYSVKIVSSSVSDNQREEILGGAMHNLGRMSYLVS